MSKNDWIPVSERLPELECYDSNDYFDYFEGKRRVLVQTNLGVYFVAICHKEYDKKRKKEYVDWDSYGTRGRRMRIINRVVAWQPLPERYEVE